METRASDKRVNYSHRPTQTKQAGQCIAGALWCMDKPWVNTDSQRLTTARTWGKPPPSPLQYSLCLAMGPTPKCHFVSRLPSWSPEILKIGIFTILETHNFVCRLSIKVKSKEKLQPLSRSFQRYVARHLHTRKSWRFLTFSDWESNWQFDSRPFF